MRSANRAGTPRSSMVLSMCARRIRRVSLSRPPIDMGVRRTFSRSAAAFVLGLVSKVVTSILPDEGKPATANIPFDSRGRQRSSLLQSVGDQILHANGGAVAIKKLGNNLGTITPKHREKRGSRADQKAGRINKIDVPALSAKPPSPVQIRAAPPNLLRNPPISPHGEPHSRRGMFPNVPKTALGFAERDSQLPCPPGLCEEASSERVEVHRTSVLVSRLKGAAEHRSSTHDRLHRIFASASTGKQVAVQLQIPFVPALVLAMTDAEVLLEY